MPPRFFYLILVVHGNKIAAAVQSKLFNKSTPGSTVDLLTVHDQVTCSEDELEKGLLGLFIGLGASAFKFVLRRQKIINIA